MEQANHEPFHEDILVPNYGLTNTVSLILDGTICKEQVPRDDCTFELERHLCCREKGICGSDIMQEACEIVGLGIVGPLRKVCFDESGSCIPRLDDYFDKKMRPLHHKCTRGYYG